MSISCALSLRRLCQEYQSSCNLIAWYHPWLRRACSQILDAPKLRDDFYMNVLDWSSQNLLAVGLGDSVYLWNAVNNNVRPPVWACASLPCAACQTVNFAVINNAPPVKRPLSPQRSAALCRWTTQCLLACTFLVDGARLFAILVTSYSASAKQMHRR